MNWRAANLCPVLRVSGHRFRLSAPPRIGQSGRARKPDECPLSEADLTVERIAARLAHGNIYVNRNMIDAVVGSQPFGGSGLSGTEPKAGGPNYLNRFAIEQVVTINTAASGSNATLLSDEEE